MRKATALILRFATPSLSVTLLTKRDCTRLQALAANVCIINMYGTTETQRAVSYFCHPPVSTSTTFLQTQKDIMPARPGHDQRPSAVVNRNERTATCAVGEVGEIYVRSGGLAEGYLGPPEVTAEKVHAQLPRSQPQLRRHTIKDKPEGQFWKGIRPHVQDGRLGTLLADGTVDARAVLTTRSNPCFRIELGEDRHRTFHATPRARERDSRAS